MRASRKAMRVFVAGKLVQHTFEVEGNKSRLLRNPSHNVKRFLRAQLHEAELLSETDAVEGQKRRDGVLTVFGRFIPTDERTGKELPSFKKRLGPEMESLYRQYHFLSEEVHPSFVASSLAYRVNIEDQEPSSADEGPSIAYDVPSRGDSGDYLAEHTRQDRSPVLWNERMTALGGGPELYDVVIDSVTTSPGEAAQKILAAMQGPAE